MRRGTKVETLEGLTPLEQNARVWSSLYGLCVTDDMIHFAQSAAVISGSVCLTGDILENFPCFLIRAPGFAYRFRARDGIFLYC